MCLALRRRSSNLFCVASGGLWPIASFAAPHNLRAWQHSLTSAMGASPWRASLLVDLDGLHHPHLLVVHHVTVQHEDAGVVEEARADDDAAAFGRPRHDRGIAPWPI